MSAIGLMSIFYTALCAISVLIAITLLLVKRPKSVRILAVVAAAYCLLLCFIDFTSLPSNQLTWRILALCWGLLAIANAILCFACLLRDKSPLPPKLVLTAALLLATFLPLLH